MTHGIMATEDGIALGTDTCIHTTAGGTEHGTHIGDITTIITLSMECTSRTAAGMEADIAPAQTGYSLAEYPQEVGSERIPEFLEAGLRQLHPKQQQVAQVQA